MHRELYDVYVAGDIVVVVLALQGTHKGPLATPMGIIPATGKRMDAPCCDVFHLKNGKIQKFDCYPLRHNYLFSAWRTAKSPSRLESKRLNSSPIPGAGQNRD